MCNSKDDVTKANVVKEKCFICDLSNHTTGNCHFKDKPCTNCGEMGHHKRKCKQDPKQPTTTTTTNSAYIGSISSWMCQQCNEFIHNDKAKSCMYCKAPRPADTTKKDPSTDQTNGTAPRPKVQEIKRDWEDTSAKDLKKNEANAKSQKTIDELEITLKYLMKMGKTETDTDVVKIKKQIKEEKEVVAKTQTSMRDAAILSQERVNITTKFDKSKEKIQKEIEDLNEKVTKAQKAKAARLEALKEQYQLDMKTTEE